MSETTPQFVGTKIRRHTIWEHDIANGAILIHNFFTEFLFI